MCKRAARYGHANLGQEMGGTKWGKNRGKGNGVWPRHLPALTGRTSGIHISSGSKDQLTAAHGGFQASFNGKGF